MLGFIRLGRMPKARNGTDNTPRNGIGICICCQQPLQIVAVCNVMRCLLSLATLLNRRKPLCEAYDLSIAGKPGLAPAGVAASQSEPAYFLDVSPQTLCLCHPP